jgi:hypothetical protein
MIDVRYKNSAGYTFILWSGNPYIEVFRPSDLKGKKISDAIPFEVLTLGNLSRSESSLKKFGNEMADYSRMV